MPTFLVVDGDESNAELLRRVLPEQNFATVDVAYNGEEALQLGLKSKYDLIILELALSRIEGLTVLRRLREANALVPILILSRCEQVDFRVAALWAGADDYLCKPFDVEELRARIRALSRRAKKQRLNLIIADLEIDTLGRRVKRGGKSIDLCNKEFAILEYLVRNAGCPVPRESLLDHVWDGNFEGVSSIIDVHISSIRRKVDHGFDEKLIHTVRGLGYLVQASRKKLQEPAALCA